MKNYCTTSINCQCGKENYNDGAFNPETVMNDGWVNLYYLVPDNSEILDEWFCSFDCVKFYAPEAILKAKNKYEALHLEWLKKYTLFLEAFKKPY